VSGYRLVRAAESDLAQRRVAGALRAEGLRAGDRVAIVAGNSPEVIAAVLGALRSGVIPVMVSPALTGGERAVILEDSAPSLVLDDLGVAALASGPDELELSPAPLARPMHYTSGTTGRPKGVWSGLLDDDGAASLLGEERSLWGFAPNDVNLVCSPLSHSAPLRFAAGTLLAGGDVVVLDKFAPTLAREAIAEHAVTSAFMAPAHLQRLFEDGLRADEVASFRLLAHAGAPCPALLKERAVATFPSDSVWEFYGSTEGQFTACSTADWRARPSSVGRPRPGRSLSIDPDSGTIWCDVPSYARFVYWGDETKTAAAWRGDAFSVFDLGRLDDEGYLYLDGRRDDLIISGGVNVYPLEIEIALARCPGVSEVAVFGVDDDRWGQRIVVAVVGLATEDSLRRFAERELAPYKRPKAYLFVDEIPKTPTGKVRRSLLAADLGL
jgi:long-chain acyl-CoA synthetase